MSEANRYNQFGYSDYSIYESGAVESRTADRIDTITARRFTSWGSPEDAVEYITREDESLQVIASREYGNSRLWWVLADFNPGLTYPLVVPAGTVLRIPNQEFISRLVSM